MTGSRFDPAPDGHHDDLSLDELDGLTLAVPDDPRELESDRLQFLAEQELAQQQLLGSPRDGDRSAGGTARSRLSRPPSRRSRLALTAAIVAGSMLVAVISGAVGAFVVPRPAAPAPDSPLASVQPLPGQIGGLLPDTTLLADGDHVDSRSLRPAVLVQVPETCPECGSWLTEVRRQASEFGMDLTLVVNPHQADQGLDLVRQLDSVGLDLMVDPYETFTQAYGEGSRTLILVRDDGVVTDVMHGPDLGLRLEGLLLPLNTALSGQT